MLVRTSCRTHNSLPPTLFTVLRNTKAATTRLPPFAALLVPRTLAGPPVESTIVYIGAMDRANTYPRYSRAPTFFRSAGWERHLLARCLRHAAVFRASRAGFVSPLPLPGYITSGTYGTRRWVCDWFGVLARVGNREIRTALPWDRGRSRNDHQVSHPRLLQVFMRGKRHVLRRTSDPGEAWRLPITVRALRPEICRRARASSAAYSGSPFIAPILACTKWKSWGKKYETQSVVGLISRPADRPFM